MAVTEESEAQVREIRAAAEEYAARVAAGERPWEDVRNDDVGETGEPETDEQVVTPETFEEDGDVEFEEGGEA